jgi:hypothetical protein
MIVIGRVVQVVVGLVTYAHGWSRLCSPARWSRAYASGFLLLSGGAAATQVLFTLADLGVNLCLVLQIERNGASAGLLIQFFSSMSTIRDVVITQKSGWPNSRCRPRPINRSLIMLPPQVDPWMFTNTGSGQYVG